jgi:hypothetical protein
MFGEVEDVIPEQGFTAGEDDDGFPTSAISSSSLNPLVAYPVLPCKDRWWRRPGSEHRRGCSFVVVSQATRRKGIALAMPVGWGNFLFSVGMSVHGSHYPLRSIVHCVHGLRYRYTLDRPMRHC